MPAAQDPYLPSGGPGVYPYPPPGGPGADPQPGSSWTSSGNHHPHPGGSSTGPWPANGPAQPWRSVWWRLGHSSWVLAPLLSCGCLSAVGFLYVGIRARRPTWWIAGLFYSLLTNVCFFLGPELEEDSLASDVVFLILLLTWAASGVHALIINRVWLRWRAGYVPWHSQPAAVWVGPPGPSGPVGSLPVPLHGLVPAPQEFYAGRPDATPSPAAGPSTPDQGPGLFYTSPGGFAGSPGPAPYLGGGPAPTGPTPTGPGSSGTMSAGSGFAGDPLAASGSSGAGPAASGFPGTAPAGFTFPDARPAGFTSGPGTPGTSAGADPAGGQLDVNTASVQQLAALPGFDTDRATRVVTERQTRRGFTGIAEFADAAGLAPHELVAVRDRVTCGPGVPQPRSTGYGRILDV